MGHPPAHECCGKVCDICPFAAELHLRFLGKAPGLQGSPSANSGQAFDCVNASLSVKHFVAQDDKPATLAALRGRDFNWGRECSGKNWGDDEKPEEPGAPDQGNEGARGVGRDVFHGAGDGPRVEGVESVWRARSVRRGGEAGAGRILRVQVKCTLYQRGTGSYCMSINMKDGAKGRRGYAAGTVDFFAIFIIPTDDWYIIPDAVVGDRDANLYFRPGLKGQKYSEYQEAWHLLVNAARGGGPVDIHACCDEAEPGFGRDVPAPGLPSGVRRRMFQRVFQG